MKISAIQIKDFLGIQAADIRLGHVTLITGANEQGKSSIFDAVRYVLCGQARGYTTGGAAELAHNRAETFQVKVRIHVGAKQLDFKRTKASGTSKVAEKLGLHPLTLRSMFETHTGNLVDLNPKQLREVMFSARQDGLSENDIAAAGIKFPDARARLLDGDFKGALRLVTEARRSLEKQLESIDCDITLTEWTDPQGTTWRFLDCNVPAMELRIKELEKEIKDASDQTETYKSAKSAVAEYKRELDGVQGEIESMAERLKNPKLNEAVAAIAEVRERVVELDAKHTAAREKEAKCKKSRKTLPEESLICPFTEEGCPAESTVRRSVELAGASDQTLIERKSESLAAQNEYNQAVAREAELAHDLGDDADILEALESKKQRREFLTRKVQQSQDKLATCGDVVDVEARKQELDAMRVSVPMAKQAQSAITPDRKSLTDQIDTLRDEEQILKDGKILDVSAGEAQDLARTILERSKDIIPLSITKDWRLEYNGRAVGLASESQQLKAGMALAAMIAAANGSRILLLDRLDVFRRPVVGQVVGLAKGYVEEGLLDQVVMFATTEKQPADLPKIRGLTTLFVEKGVVRPI